MTFVVAYDVATSYSDVRLELRRVDSGDGIARVLATAERAWFGEVFFDGEQIEVPDEPLFEPGYALVIDHGDRGRPEQRPRDAHITVHEYFDPSALIEDARRRAQGVRPPSAVIGVRVLQRKPVAEHAWPPDARVLRAESVAHPDDDAPRLVFADAIAGKRGSLVIVQCDLARGGMTPPESRSRRRTQRDLLAKQGTAWSRLTGLAKRCVFRRGFVESAEISRDVLVNDHARLFDAAPHLASIAIDAQPTMYVRQLAQLGASEGWWKRLRGLSIDGGMLAHNFDGMLGGLRALEISRVGQLHAGLLLGSSGLRDLEILWLPSHELDNDTLGRLLATSPNLRVLDVATARSNAAVTIPDSVRELYAAAFSVGALPRGLEKLAFYGQFVTSRLDGLTALRSLDLSAAFARDPLHELVLPALRELRLSIIKVDDILQVAKAFGAQLELLDVRGIAGVDAIADELRELVAGDVWIGKADVRRPLMPASYMPDEPMWDVGEVELSG